MQFESLLAEDRFRQASHRPEMAGCTMPSFICVSCKKSRRTAGRKRRGFAWVCRGCHEARRKESGDNQETTDGSGRNAGVGR